MTAMQPGLDPHAALQHLAFESFRQLPDPTLVLDLRGHIVLASDAACHYFGDEGSEALQGQSVLTLLNAVLCKTDQVPISHQNLLDKRQAIELAVQDFHGHCLLLKTTPCRLASSTIHSGWVLRLVNVTGGRQAQEQRDQALHFISHDIRAPQSSILTLIELYRNQPGMMTEHELVQRIERQARAALELAESFVYLSQAQAHLDKFEEVDLCILLEEAMDDNWVKANERNIELVLSTSPDQALCHADPVLLRRAISNVLNNAIKFAPAGSHIDCAIEAHGSVWHLSIHDDGPGIDKDKQARLFQPFERLHGQSHPQIKGMGLGLVFVQTVLHKHAGQVLIDSDQGMGCTFTFVLNQLA